MNFWRAMAARGDDCERRAMSFPSFSNRPAGEGRLQMQRAFGSAKEELQVRGPSPSCGGSG
jgi:hypothetical protein